MKEKTIIKILFYALIGSFCILAIFFIHIFLLYLTDDKDMCLDTGVCREGLTTNIGNEQIEVHQDTCTKYSGTWVPDLKHCKFK